MSLDELLHRVPVATHSMLPIAWSKTMDRIEGDVARCIICKTHSILANAIQTMQDMGPFDALRLVMSVLLERDVQISLSGLVTQDSRLDKLRTTQCKM
jgi:hypothetical protein